MSRYLRPDRFDVGPNSTEADLKWSHWRFTFENFLTKECTTETKDTMQLNVLVNHLSPTLFSYIRGVKSYDIAMKTLEEIHVKPKNEILSRHLQAIRIQKPEESVFMACRDMEKCESSRREIVLETNNKYVYCRHCDRASTFHRTTLVRGDVSIPIIIF
ncbi:unnamed protein product [Chilo suppressalis]|uniref:Uncharacterized protein n=1 Tax=Chilo suppressalis TaxID=168631 RepID=A0ABN8L3R7_CHISP|nr:unnamed protein product [Chilo suppressalis]